MRRSSASGDASSLLRRLGRRLMCAARPRHRCLTAPESYDGDHAFFIVGISGDRLISV